MPGALVGATVTTASSGEVSFSLLDSLSESLLITTGDALVCAVRNGETAGSNVSSRLV